MRARNCDRLKEDSIAPDEIRDSACKASREELIEPVGTSTGSRSWLRAIWARRLSPFPSPATVVMGSCSLANPAEKESSGATMHYRLVEDVRAGERSRLAFTILLH